MGLQSLIQTSASGAGSIGTGQASTKRNYYAVALVDKGQLPAIGASYTLLSTTSVTVSGSTLASVVKDLAYRNKARFIPDGFMKGVKADTTNLNDGEIYGDNALETPSGEVTELFTVTFKNYYQNVFGFNAVRSNSEGYDVVLFTNNTAEIYTRASNNTQIVNIRDSADGSNTSKRNGMFDISTRGQDGQVVPLEGVYKADLADDLRFTFTVGTLDNLTAGNCSGAYARYTRTTGGQDSSIPFTVAPIISCKTFYLYVLLNGVLQPSTGATYATINSTTGEVTFPIAHVASAKYVVVCENEVGVRGEYKLEFIV